MKVLDLQCANAHVFEGWFADETTFQSQLSDGLVACPVCANCTVHKLLSAPRINRGAAPATAAAPPSTNAAQDSGGQGQWMQRAREALARAEDVGERFATEARAIHEGESPSRTIRGVASAEQTRELLSDGILVLPLPAALSGTLH
ncbi:MAG: DUF1178 family protein [Giesbergeria sp.]